MNIQSNQYHFTPNFKGLDARPLKGFVMSSNYAGIASEMRKIGELENFKVFLLTQTSRGHELLTDNFEKSTKYGGWWAQDFFGIVKDTLLEFENTEKSQLLRHIFKFRKNPVQNKIREELSYPEMQAYVDMLYNLPRCIKNGNEGYLLNMGTESMFIDETTYNLEFSLNSKILKDLLRKTHIKGGNYFLTKNSDGKEDLLVGKNELKKFSIEQMKEMFQVDKVHILPQGDYHLDLFVRPLKDKKVLIADDEASVKILEDAFKKIEQAILAQPIEERMQFKDAYIRLGSYSQQFKEILNQNSYAKMEDVETALLDAGYKPIKVPARIFEILGGREAGYSENKIILRNLLNFINAHVHINSKGETIYITNKSNIDETLGLTEKIQKLSGVSVEKMFLDKIRPYVDKIYTVSGKDNAIAKELLPEYYGGIHCMGMEFP